VIAPPAAAWPNYAQIAHVNAPEKKAVVISHRLRLIRRDVAGDLDLYRALLTIRRKRIS
jgi:hypothetical protein